MMPATVTAIPIYPQFDLEDEELDRFSSLFNGRWVWREYRSQFGELYGTPYRIRIRQVSHDPGRRAVVSYIAEWHLDEFLPEEQFALEIRRGRDVSVYRYPEDPHLPGLKEAASVEPALKLLNRHVLSVPARRLRVDMVRYRPGNRAVLRHRLGRVNFYARVMRPDTLAPHLKAASLVQRSGFTVPRLAGCWKNGGVLWMSEIPGRNLRRQIRRGHQPSPGTLLDGLVKLWDVPMQDVDTRPFNLAGAYRRAKRAFIKALADDLDGRLILKDATRSLDPFVESWRPSHIAHNDFYDDQMLALPDSRIALVDFEEAGPGDPMLDVGNFLAHLRWTFHFGREQEASAKIAYYSIFRTASLDRLGWSEQELALREAVCLFRVCTNAIRHPRPDWRDRLKEGLSLVNDVIG